MSDHSLPKTVDPLKYADQNKILDGVLPVQQLPRLVELLASEQGSVQAHLEFDRDEQKLRVLKGVLDAQVDMTCERCLQPVSKQIKSEFTLGIVLTDEDAKQLPKRYEPLLVEPESLELSEVIEEEMILSLPMFAYHQECSGEYQQDEEQVESSETEQAESKPNPFSVLSDLKLKN